MKSKLLTKEERDKCDAILNKLSDEDYLALAKQGRSIYNREYKENHKEAFNRVRNYNNQWAARYAVKRVLEAHEAMQDDEE